MQGSGCIHIGPEYVGGHEVSQGGLRSKYVDRQTARNRADDVSVKTSGAELLNYVSVCVDKIGC